MVLRDRSIPPEPVNDHGPRAGPTAKAFLALQHRGTLPVSGWRGDATGDAADAPHGYRLDLSVTNRVSLTTRSVPSHLEGEDEASMRTHTEPEGGDNDGAEEDDDAVNGSSRWSAPREARSFTQTRSPRKAPSGSLPAARASGSPAAVVATTRGQRGMSAYRPGVPPRRLNSLPAPRPAAQLPEHTALPHDHPFR